MDKKEKVFSGLNNEGPGGEKEKEIIEKN